MFSVMHITSRSDIGGGPEHLYQLIQNLPKTVESYIACPNDEPYHQKYSEATGSDHIFDIPHRSFKLSSLLRLRKTALRHKIDLIHSHGKGAGTYSRLLALTTKVPCVHTFHGLHTGEYSNLQKSFYLLYERAMSFKTNKAICVSSGERDQILKSKIFTKRKLQVIDNGVSVPPYPKESLHNSLLKIIAVSRYDEQKNPELLVEIASLLKGKIPFQLTVIGQGERMQQTKAKIEQRGLQDIVKIAGSTNDPRGYYRESDVFLSTSRWEGMPLAVLEAMSEGLPVVASNVVGNNDIIDNSTNGLLYDINKPEEAVDAISRLTCPTERNKIGTAAHQTVQSKYSVKRMAEETYRIYQKVLA